MTIVYAIGEAYDTIGRWLGLDMRRGGDPAVEELAQEDLIRCHLLMSFKILCQDEAAFAVARKLETLVTKDAREVEIQPRRGCISCVSKGCIEAMKFYIVYLEPTTLILCIQIEQKG
ncbi:hypothetical protein NE237_031014 [Protea cynaroides]|uniref:Uncharacterized protein n=1 Tax=Protea cynaroides TaxID=273540 RepID=A0A9Q0JWK8_9MAGN|nr:hypothetical protein NE237_031014 [Protea cynaroides]